MKNLIIKTLLILNLIFFNFIIVNSQNCPNEGESCDDGDPLTFNEFYDSNCLCLGFLPLTLNETICEGSAPIELSSYFTDIDYSFESCYIVRLAGSLAYNNETVQLNEPIFLDYSLNESQLFSNVTIDPNILFVDVSGEIFNAGELIDPVNPLTCYVPKVHQSMVQQSL